MPATSPLLTPPVAERLLALGAQVRLHRKRLDITAVAAAESAGMSRVTWHRIEKGEPSVAMGAYMSAAAALGLEFTLHDPHAQAHTPESPPDRIRIADYPQLQRLAWALKGVAELTPAEAFELYERNWRHVDRQALDPRERRLVELLAATLGGGRLLV